MNRRLDRYPNVVELTEGNANERAERIQSFSIERSIEADQITLRALAAIGTALQIKPLPPRQDGRTVGQLRQARMLQQLGLASK